MGNVCIVTGGSRGIGAECAKLAANAGYTVCLSYVSDEAAASQVVSDIENKGGTAKAVKCDVANETDIVNLFSEADKIGPLKALVNNAGIVGAKQRVDEYTNDRLQRMFAINVTGTILCAREAVKRMSTSHGHSGGVIVNMSSAAAKLGSPNEYVDYAASKAAIDTFTKGLALEVAGEGIRVNAVRPGLIHTDIHASGGQPDRVERLQHMIPMKRGGTAQEIANAVSWLMSDSAAYVTGECVNVTGGR